MAPNYSKLRGWITEKANANPQSWRSFFNKYDVSNSEPGLAVLEAYRKHGREAVEDVNDLLIGDIAAYVGNEKLSNSIQTVESILQWAGVFVSDDMSDEEKQEAIEIAEREQALEEEKEAMKTRNLLFVFFSIITIIILVFIIIKNQS
jgi:hypothetical protein